MYAKIEILGKIEVQSGLHIGGSDAFAAIGAIDSPVVRDLYSNLPIIPGSSLKGKMRSLLARRYSGITTNPNDDVPEILRLFGSSTEQKYRIGRLIFSDAILDNHDELKARGINGTTEAKFENTIKRSTSEAMPRQIERVVRGAEFPLNLIYNLNDGVEEKEVLDDIQMIKEGFTLLSYDYLGGNGTRGYGKVAFRDWMVEARYGDVSEKLLEKIKEIICS